MSFDWFNDPLLPTIIISCVAHIARYTTSPRLSHLLLFPCRCRQLYLFTSSAASSYSLLFRLLFLCLSNLVSFLPFLCIFWASSLFHNLPRISPPSQAVFSTLFLSISFFHPSSLLSRFSLLFPSRCTALLFPYFFFAVSSVCKQNNLIEWKRVCLFATRKRIRRKRAYVQKVAKTVAWSF